MPGEHPYRFSSMGEYFANISLEIPFYRTIYRRARRRNQGTAWQFGRNAWPNLASDQISRASRSNVVESTMGASTDVKRRPVSHRRSSNRTCPIKASGFPTVFTADSRTITVLHLTKPEYSPVAKNRVRREAIGAARLHLVAPPQEMSYALIDVVVNRPIGCRSGPVAEVCRPASQNLIQPIPHLQPCPRIAGYQMVSHFLLDARYALLGRTGSHVPTACLLIALWPERVTQKVEAFFGGLF